MADSMSDFEIAVLATQIRANLARLREFVSFPDADELALDRTDHLMQGLIQPAEKTVRSLMDPPLKSPEPAAETQEERDAREAMDRLRAAHPRHHAMMSSLMWMGLSGGSHLFKHSDTRRAMTFDPATGTVSCTIETGETSHDPDVVFREIATL